jgi:hypothetical protein
MTPCQLLVVQYSVASHPSLLSAGGALLSVATRNHKSEQKRIVVLLVQ